MINIIIQKSHNPHKQTSLINNSSFENTKTAIQMKQLTKTIVKPWQKQYLENLKTQSPKNQVKNQKQQTKPQTAPKTDKFNLPFHFL